METTLAVRIAARRAAIRSGLRRPEKASQRGRLAAEPATPAQMVSGALRQTKSVESPGVQRRFTRSSGPHHAVRCHRRCGGVEDPRIERHRVRTAHVDAAGERIGPRCQQPRRTHERAHDLVGGVGLGDLRSTRERRPRPSEADTGRSGDVDLEGQGSDDRGMVTSAWSASHQGLVPSPALAATVMPPSPLGGGATVVVVVTGSVVVVVAGAVVVVVVAGAVVVVVAGAVVVVVVAGAVVVVVAPWWWSWLVPWWWSWLVPWWWSWLVPWWWSWPVPWWWSWSPAPWWLSQTSCHPTSCCCRRRARSRLLRPVRGRRWR